MEWFSNATSWIDYIIIIRKGVYSITGTGKQYIATKVVHKYHDITDNQKR